VVILLQPKTRFFCYAAMNNIAKLMIAVIIPVAVGGLSGYFTASGVGGWYATLQKPWFNPPNWIFGPVWTALYAMMGVALYLVWKQPPGPARNSAITWFAVQLTVNFFWSFIFFYLHQPGWAFAEIVVMWVLILVTIFQFAKLSTAAAWLLVPYISWVSFAAVLNFTLWRMNA
jgi:translocator protein